MIREDLQEREVSRERMTDQMSVLREDLARIKADLRSLSSTLTGEGKAAARAVADDVSRRAGHSFRSVERFMGERPLTTIGIAFGVGLVAGKLLGRR